jgi:hypothetical protein
MTQIGLPEKRIIEVEPLVEPVPGELPDWVFEPEKEPLITEPTKEPVHVPA